ncbi:MAG: amidase [Actinomycetaceae bacterium]|nr:amidase [Actinomycetaceae bacterium]
MEIFELSARELAAQIRNKDISAVEVTEATLERAETVGAQVGAFTYIAHELALDQARAADNAFAAGNAGPFAGVPVPIKDLNQVAGVPFEAGSVVMRGNIAQVDDAITELFARAGTIMVGKTTTPEFAFPPYTEPVAGPKARTPWDLSRTAGGSSGGAGAAVASGIVSVAHGSDGGGSIRIPAAANGIVGMKPSRGRISAAPGADGPGLATNGVLTRDVRDSAAFLDVLSTPQAGDPWMRALSGQTFLEACDQDPGRLRIGLLLEPLVCDEIDLHPQSRQAAELTARALEDLGHHVEMAPRPMNGTDWETFMPLWATAAAGIPLPDEAVPMLEPLTRWLRQIGHGYSAVDYANAINGMQTLSRRLAHAWADFDVILTPVLAPGPLRPEDLMKADPAEDFMSQRRFTPWTSIFNMTGTPSISLPVHAGPVADEQAPRGEVILPFNVMLSAVQPGTEAMLFALSAQLEAALPWQERQIEVIRRF